MLADSFSPAAVLKQAAPLLNGHTPAPSTTGTVNYVQRPPKSEGLFVEVYKKKEGDKPLSNLKLTSHEVPVTNVRPEKFTLEQQGFRLVNLEVPEDIDWDDGDDVRARYYPEVEKLLLKESGGTRVHVFDHTLRRGALKKTESDEFQGSQPNQPVGMAHVDYTHDSGIDRLDALLPDEAERLRKTPFAVIQVWRPLKGPVTSSPLGVIDCSTVESEDLIPYQIRFPGRTGYNFAVAHNPNHKWYFADGINTDEAYVFVCYDSRLDRARFTPHTGFRDHRYQDDSSVRESVELRAYVFWEDLPPQEVKRVW